MHRGESIGGWGGFGKRGGAGIFDFREGGGSRLAGVRTLLFVVAVVALYFGACLSVPRTRECWFGDGDVKAARRMVEDGELIGLLPREVPARFGEPRTGRFGTDLHYYLGPDGGFCVDSTWLVVNLGEEGRITFAGIATD